MASMTQKRTKYGQLPTDLINQVLALSANENRDLIDAATKQAITDSSTGTDNGAIGAVVGADPFVSSGADMTPKTAFDTAVGKIDNATAVLAEVVNEMLAAVALTEIVQNATSTIAVSGTVAACDKTLTATDGSGDTAVVRISANAQLIILKNNMATLIRGANDVSIAMQTVEINDLATGIAEVVALVLVDTAATATGVDGTANDGAADSEIDVALTALVDNIAHVAQEVTDLQVLADAATHLATNITR